MKASDPHTPSILTRTRFEHEPWLWVTLIAAAVLIVYYPALHAPFIFDDIDSIVFNLAVHHFRTSFWSPDSTGLAGRPFAGLTFAANFLLGSKPIWFRLVNIFIHGAAALVLFGIIRRILFSIIRDETTETATRLAGTIALLWAIHPVQTEAVTYISQRTESLMGLWYLLTFYGFLRSLETPHPFRWQMVSFLACVFGALTKEIIATVPIVIFLYDRTFVSDNVAAAWRTRRYYYLSLASVWILLSVLVAHVNRGNVGLNQGVSAWDYALTSTRSILIYLRLSIWPRDLVLDYGLGIVHRISEVWSQLLILLGAIVATLVGLWKRSRLAWMSAGFFGILAPVSSVIPILGQPTAEHRLYLSLAFVVAAVVLFIYRALGDRSFLIFGALAGFLGYAAAARNQVYNSELALWADTIKKVPSNPRAQNNVGNCLMKVPARTKEAMEAFDRAIELDPKYADAYINRADARLKISGDSAGALDDLKNALVLKPNSADAYNNLGNVFLKIPGRKEDASHAYLDAVQLNPEFAVAYFNLGNVWATMPGHEDDALKAMRSAVQYDAASCDYHYHLGFLLSKKPSTLPAAIDEFAIAIRLNPSFAPAHFSWGSVLMDDPLRLKEAVDQLRTAVSLQPDWSEAHLNLGTALTKSEGGMAEAAAEFEHAASLDANSADARFNRANALIILGGSNQDIISNLKEVVRIRPEDADAHYLLGRALAENKLGRTDAIAHLETALKLRPEMVEAQILLGQLHHS